MKYQLLNWWLPRVHTTLETLQKSSFTSICWTQTSLCFTGKAYPRWAALFLSLCFFPPSLFRFKSPPCQQRCCVLLNPIRRRGERQARFSRAPWLHTKLAAVPFSIPAAPAPHTRNGKALCGCSAGCSALKSAGGAEQVFGQPFKGKGAGKK